MRGASINILRQVGAQLLRVVPGSTALRLKRDLRDRAWLSQADSVVISFPKSGRTFVRAMLARLYQRRFGIDEKQLLEFPLLRRSPADAPKVLFTHAGDAMRRPSEVRVEPSDYAGKRMVLIARHPADVSVSRYHHLKHRSRDKARRRLADQPLDRFIWAEQGGIPSIVTFLNRFASLPDVTIIRYEDFLTDTRASLMKLAEAIGVSVDQADIDDAVEFGQLANLKALERDNYFTSPRLRRARGKDEQSGKVRSGTSGGYRAQLSADEAARVDAYVSENLDRRFGYSGA